MPNKKKLDFDVKRYLVAEVLYPDHVVPLHVGECVRGRPFDSWGGGAMFFCEKKIVQQILKNLFSYL